MLNRIQDYYASFYIAELVNTLTNAWFMYLAYLGIVSCRKYGHDTIFLVTFYGYLVVGSGSFAFHASLKCMSTVQVVVYEVPNPSDIDSLPAL